MSVIQVLRDVAYSMLWNQVIRSVDVFLLLMVIIGTSILVAVERKVSVWSVSLSLLFEVVHELSAGIDLIRILVAERVVLL